MADHTDPTQAPDASSKKSNPFTKVVHSIKDSMPGKKEKEEPSPALQEAIQKMEARKAAKIAEMQAEGKDTSRHLEKTPREAVGWEGGAQGAGGVVISGLGALGG